MRTDTRRRSENFASRSLLILGGDGLGHRVAAVGGHALGEVLAGRGGEGLHVGLVAGLGLVLGDGALGARLLGLHRRGGCRIGLLRRLQRLEALQRGLQLGELGGLRVELPLDSQASISLYLTPMAASTSDLFSNFTSLPP